MVMKEAWCRTIFWVCCGWLVWVPCAAAAPSFDLGFLASHQETITGAKRTTALGPFYESVQMPDGTSMWAIRPFYVQALSKNDEMKHEYYVWPLAAQTHFKHELKWRVLMAYGRKRHPGSADSPYMRFNIFPFYFQFRDDAGKLSVAVFPIGGTIRDFFFYDRISFVLFPLWTEWQSNDVLSENLLWPLISWTKSMESEDIRRFRILPFYAHSVKKEHYDKRSILWPIWNMSHYTAEGSKGYAYVLFPLFGRINRESEKGWMFLPPFIRFSYGRDGSFVNCPWPFFQYRNTKYMKKFTVWPLYSQRRVGPLMNRYFLWPLGWQRSVEFKKSRVWGFQLVPFFIWDHMTQRREDGTLGEVTHRYAKLWPLFTYRRDKEVRQTRVLELWPFRDHQGELLSWAPFWTLFSHTVVKDKGYDTEILWGLYRQQRKGTERRYNALFPLYDYERDEQINGGKKEWSFLKGLIGYKREYGIRRYRFLYLITFGGKRATE
ncbi:MAG: hypothetical protein PHG65_00805 [Kiritimatiellae bacterium]|nr:hypothetical protein [Kiritimatiellia bacterium]